MSATLLIRPAPIATPSQLTETHQTLLQDLDRLDAYPMFSETTLWAMAMMNNPDIALAEVANLIRRDPVIATAVLRRANDWRYGGRSIDNIQQAVLRVGLQECGKLLCTMGMRAMYNRHSHAVQDRCDAVHRHSLFVAQLASEINRTSGFGFNGVEFTAGLLHDIGRVVLFVKCPLGATHSASTSALGEDVLRLERAQFGVDHCELGYQFTQRNKLSEQLIRAILHHHRPEEEHFEPDLVALVAMANRIANYTQFEHNITGYDRMKCPIFPVFARRWNGQQEEAFTRALPGIEVRAIKNTRIMLKSFSNSYQQ